MSVIFNRFMQDVEHENINTAVVPYLANKPWAKNLIDTWLNSEEISKPVKNAIEVHNNKAPLKVGKG